MCFYARGEALEPSSLLFAFTKQSSNNPQPNVPIQNSGIDSKILFCQLMSLPPSSVLIKMLDTILGEIQFSISLCKHLPHSATFSISSYAPFWQHTGKFSS